jgi:hypothetical protein
MVYVSVLQVGHYGQVSQRNFLQFKHSTGFITTWSPQRAHLLNSISKWISLPKFSIAKTQKLKFSNHLYFVYKYSGSKSGFLV